MPSDRRTVLPIILLVLATLIVLGRCCAADFVQWDDPDMVQQNPGLNPPGLGKVVQFWRGPYLGLYTPLAYTAWSAVAFIAQPASAPAPESSSGHLDPVPFHLFTLLLHAAAATFVFLILREVVPGALAPWAGAMLFALHPLQVEPVCWVAGMNNVLCGALGLAAVWQYVLYAKARGDDAQTTRHARRHFLYATALFAAALLSKPSAVVLPGIVAALDLWILRRKFTVVARPIAGWLLLAAPLAIAARLIQPAKGIVALSPIGRLAVAMDALGFYLRKLVAPIHLTFDYGRTPEWVLAHPSAIGFGAISLAFAAILCIAGRSVRGLAAGLMIVVIGLLPVLGLTPFDFQNYSTVADRYMYLPMFGAALAAAALLARRPHRLSWMIAAIVMIALCIGSFDQAGVWRDTPALAAHELQVNPGNGTAHKILAAFLAAQGHDDQAAPEYEMAIAILSHQPRADGAVWYDYGNLLRRQGKLSEAIAEYRQAIPRLMPAPRAAAYNNMGSALAQSGDDRAARAAFRAALILRPDYADAKRNLSHIGND